MAWGFEFFLDELLWGGSFDREEEEPRVFYSFKLENSEILSTRPWLSIIAPCLVGPGS